MSDSTTAKLGHDQLILQRVRAIIRTRANSTISSKATRTRIRVRTSTPTRTLPKATATAARSIITKVVEVASKAITLEEEEELLILS